MWDKVTSLRLYDEGADGSKVNQDEKFDYKIGTLLLSKFIDRTIDFLKIDIEGAEFRVINEIKDHLKKVSNIFIEYHSDIKEKQKLNKILSILTKNGFRYYIESTGVKSFSPFQKIEVSNGFDNQLNIYGYR